ncbi:phosphate ABC transporter substrate-binding protein PstS [Hydrogenophaga taeniospiralis]|uniref:phosphate ABC transporter substrate-binding protein PstS n=1 Tax=Hydrogenophaga taeniospiralis TaxID=65656 RepID=UPI001CF93BBD|nr:phosphate ABC transporter substrate-binding protein PstS [Hydrogenophaga taeniospiralis]UCU96804.1 phosphate ABC transporter substrate-binding protein PstS [Hydrogenophaga taeniospiralis]
MNTKRTLLKTVAAAALATMAMGNAFAADITGAGATFPFPVYAKWAEAYKKETGTGLNYQSIGSSGGLKQIRAKTVTFGASDAPVKGEELDKDGMIQFPAIIGGTVPVINLDGFKPGELRVTGPVLADMFLGNITKWNDAKLVALNPGKALPDASITIVHRADGSGTTFNWTDYLTAVSKDWADKVGKGAAVKWPAASSVGGKGNEGVAANVNRVKGALGYVEYAYVKKNKMNFMQLQNADGKYVSPDDTAFAAAAASADWFSVPGMGISMVNAKGAASWPVSTASFILMYKQPEDKVASAEALKFFDWAFKSGKQMAADLDYVALPDSLTDQIRSKVWSQIAK